MFQVSKIFAVIFCFLKTDISSVVIFFFYPYSLVSSFTAHPDLLDQKERKADDDFCREKQVPVTHTHTSTHTLLELCSTSPCHPVIGVLRSGENLERQQEDSKTT